MTELLLMQVETSDQTAKNLGAAAHQSLAALVMNALLLHELERVGIVDHDIVVTEAIRRATSIRPSEVGASVAQVIKTVFDGELPVEHGPAGVDDKWTGAKQ
ncbi:hypothetical protein CIW48_28200 [Methylobacterium sp. P1-11]|nr:hypothetical protein CIW48_28200 [Methylobacterium sp. P1-11]